LGDAAKEYYDMVSFADVSGAGGFAQALIDYEQGKISDENFGLQLGALILSQRSPVGKKLQAQINKAIGILGELTLGKLVWGAQRALQTSSGTRIVDRLVTGAAGLVAHESKVGYISLRGFIKDEIAKDAELLRTGQITQVVWHFYENPTTGKIGATQSVPDEFTKNGIQYIIHSGVNVAK
jgi:hypothetical protein